MAIGIWFCTFAILALLTFPIKGYLSSVANFRSDFFTFFLASWKWKRKLFWGVAIFSQSWHIGPFGFHSTMKDWRGGDRNSDRREGGREPFSARSRGAWHCSCVTSVFPVSCQTFSPWGDNSRISETRFKTAHADVCVSVATSIDSVSIWVNPRPVEKSEKGPWKSFCQEPITCLVTINILYVERSSSSSFSLTVLFMQNIWRSCQYSIWYHK